MKKIVLLGLPVIFQRLCPNSFSWCSSCLKELLLPEAVKVLCQCEERDAQLLLILSRSHFFPMAQILGQNHLDTCVDELLIMEEFSAHELVSLIVGYARENSDGKQPLLVISHSQAMLSQLKRHTVGTELELQQSVCPDCSCPENNCQSPLFPRTNWPEIAQRLVS